MNSLPEDREQAERRARMTKRRTPAQEKRRAQRETAFNAGYDASAFAEAEKLGFMVNPSRLQETRRRAYSHWEYAEDRE